MDRKRGFQGFLEILDLVEAGRGHLSVKNGKYYAVLNYRNAKGERRTKWISLGLPEKGNKRKAEGELARLRAEFEIPEEVGDLSGDMLVQNVADKVDRPRKNDFQPVFLSAEEMQKMLEALRGTRLELPVLVAAFYGSAQAMETGLALPESSDFGSRWAES